MHKVRQLFKALKWQKQVRAAVSTQLALLENPTAFALGGMTEEEELRLGELSRLAGRFAGPLVEFGCLFGLTTRLLASEAREGQSVIAIDNFSWNPFGLTPALHEGFTRKVLRSELADGKVRLVKEDSAAFRTQYDGETPAMVFLDADHSYSAVRDEISWALRLGVPVICGHDYGNPDFGVTRAVDEAFPGGVCVRGMVWSNVT
jgi:hypothetical protein